MVDDVARAPRESRLIAADTSSLQRYFAGVVGSDTRLVAEAFENQELILPPVVQTELFADPWLSPDHAARILLIPLLPIVDGVWQRAGLLRAVVRALKYKAEVADALIAQWCIDHEVPLVTYDRDFRHFKRVGLKLL